MLCGRLDGRGVWERMDTCICMAESIGCSLETVTTLLTGCNLNTKKKLKKKKQLEIRIKLQLLTWFHQCTAEVMEVYQITQGVCVHQDRLGYARVWPKFSDFKQQSPVLIHDSCWLWVSSSLLSFNYSGCLNSCWLKGGQVGSGGRELWGVSHKQESALVPPVHSRLVKAYHKVLQARSTVLLYAREVGWQEYMMSITQNYQTLSGMKNK